MAGGRKGGMANANSEIRLAHVYNAQAAGGGNVQAQTLLSEWRNHGFDAWGVHATNTGFEDTFVTEEPGYPLMYPNKLTEGLKEIGPDIVLVHGYSPTLDQQLKDLSDSDDFDAVFALRKGMNLFEYWLGAAASDEPKKTTYQITGFDWYDAIICPTRAASERVSIAYGDDCPRLAVVPNGIRRDDYVPSSFMQDGFLRVVTASRLAPNNYVLSPLLAVMRMISQEELPVKMDIYGPANNVTGPVVGSLASEYDDITIHGNSSHDEVREAVERSDVVCVPSVSQQAIPLAALEGMAGGNVVLGSFYEAQEEEAIIQVPAAQPPRWYDALKDAYDDPEDAREWVRKGMERAAQYSVENVVAEGYRPVFEDLIHDR